MKFGECLKFVIFPSPKPVVLNHLVLVAHLGY
jgi:hypothetical protein